MILLKNNLQGLILEAQDSTFYEHVAHAAGASSFFDLYIERLEATSAMPESIQGMFSICYHSLRVLQSC